MKRSGLKRDPEKAREFVERGRGKLKTDPERARAFEQRGRQSAAALGRGRSASGAQVVPEGQARRAAAPERPRGLRRARFRGPTPAREHTCAKAGCDRRAASFHHWLPQQHIRGYVRSLRLDDDDAEFALTRRLLNDERNVSPFCRDHHADHGSTSHEFEIGEVPQSAYDFAVELGAEWVAKLVQTYRGRFQRPHGAA